MRNSYTLVGSPLSLVAMAIAAMAKTENLISLLPSEAVQGGLIDDADVECQDAEFTIFDYNGKSDPKVCLKLNMKDADGNLHEQYFSAADPKHFAPSQDGNGIVPTGDKANLNKGSNYYEFVLSLVNAGFPEPNLKEGAAAFNGLGIHISRKPAPASRSGIINQEGKKDATVLVVTKLNYLPGEGGDAKKGGAKKTAAATGKPATAAKASTKADDSNEVDEELKAILIGALAEGESLKKAKLVQVVFKVNSPNKKAMTQRVGQDEFLEAGVAEGLWAWDGKELSAAE